MKIKHSKFRNTGLIFELLVKQIAADTLDKQDSAAIDIFRACGSPCSIFPMGGADIWNADVFPGAADDTQHDQNGTHGHAVKHLLWRNGGLHDVSCVCW